jgi:hypothetical protein
VNTYQTRVSGRRAPIIRQMDPIHFVRLLLSTPVPAWSTAQHFAKCATKCAFRLVAQGEGNVSHTLFAIHELIGRQQHSPTREVCHRGFADNFLEALCKDRAGHADTPCQFLKRPGMRGVFMHARDRRSDGFISQSKQPGFAYVLFFRLVERFGAAYAASVTFLIPIFGMIWGAAFLGETITPAMIAGCAIVLFGTALASGRLGWMLTRSA